MSGEKKLGAKPALTLATVKLTCLKANLFGLTVACFVIALVAFSLWNTPQNRYSGLSYVFLLVGIASSAVVFLIPYVSEYFGLIPYQRYRSFLCFYRLAFFFKVPALVCVLFGYGRLYSMGTKAKEHDLGVRLEDVQQTMGPGDYFRVVDGFVSLEQTRVMAYTRSLHSVREGDEMWENEYSYTSLGGINGTNDGRSWSETAEAESTAAPLSPNLPTQYHQIPPPWLTIETKSFDDIENTATVAPVFAEGENCLERPPPTNRVCYERNEILGFAVKSSPGFCRQIGSITCKVEWNVLQLRPSYGCNPEAQDPSKYPNVATEFDHGLCGRIILPQGIDLVLVSQALRRFKADGWKFPQDIQSIMFIDVSNDTCIAEEEQCREDYSNIGFVGVMSACVAIALVVLSCGMDVHHDYLMRQLMFLDEKELQGTRKIRRQLEADKLRQQEVAQYEQTMRLQELHNTLTAQMHMAPKNADGTPVTQPAPGTNAQQAPAQDGMFKPLPGAVPPVQ